MSIFATIRNKVSSSCSLLKLGVQEFPLAWVYALVTTILLVLGVHYQWKDHGHEWIFAGIMGGTFGTLCALASGIFQKDKPSPKWILLSRIASIAAGPLFGWWAYGWMLQDTAKEMVFVQVVSFYCISALLVYLSHFRIWNQEKALADWGILLGYSGGVSYVMAGLLSAGITLTLVSVEKLFDVDVDGDVYAYVWTLTGFFLGISYFLGTVVENLSAKLSVPAQSLLPRLVQWVLRPVLTVYFLVIFAYAIKIAISQELPRGIISAMVIGYGIVGFIAVLQMAWWSEATERPLWTRLFAYTFPLPTMLLCIALWRRVSEYGWTESRILLLLGLIAIVIGIFGVAWKGAKALLAVALSLLVISLGFGLGEYGWSAVAQKSQLERLQLMISQNADDAALGDVARHLKSRYGKESMKGILDSVRLEKLLTTYQNAESVYWSAFDDTSFIVEGYTRCREFRADRWSAETRTGTAQFRILAGRHLVGPIGADSMRADVGRISDSLFALKSQYSIRGEWIRISQDSWQILFRNLSLSKTQSQSGVQSAEGLVCWKPRPL